MKALRPWSVAIVLVVVSGAFLLAPVAAQVKPPADFAFSQGKDSPGAVSFSHEKHVAAGNKCTACHVKVFKMKKGAPGEITMAKMKEGQQCGACHNGKTDVGGKVPFATDDKANCEKCHKK